MKTVTLQIRLKSVAVGAPVASHEAPRHPSPLLYLGGACSIVDQTEHVETVHKRGGDMFSTVSFSVAVSAPSQMSKGDIAAYVESRLTHDYPTCAANAFWESVGTEAWI